nr:reverse transcriptase domain-containing protein [Tanacetum cinerariifolium]
MSRKEFIPTPSKVVKQGTEATKDPVQTTSPQSTAHVQPPITQSETPVSEPIVAPVSAPMPNLKPSIPYPSRRDNERRLQTTSPQSTAHVQPPVTQSETPVSEPIVAPVSAPMPNLKPSILYPSMRDDEKRREQANEQIEKFYEIFKADLGASINLMPLSVWKELSLPELTPTCMTLELADRSVSKPIGIAKDIKVKVADFVVVDFEPDPQVSLILGRCFLKADRALIDVHKGELSLRIGNEAITYNLDQTSRYSANYDQMTANKIDVTNEACEEYF